MASNAERIQFLLGQGDGFTRSRLPALYADFVPQRATNPEGYAANVAVWRRALAALVRAGQLPSTATATGPHRLVLTAGPPLVDALASDRYGRPQALPAVVAEAARDGALVPLGAFLQARTSVYAGGRGGRGGGGGGSGSGHTWAAWAAGLPWQALAWGVRQVVGGGGGGGTAPAYDSTTTTDYVVVANVEAAAAAFAAQTADLRSAYERTWSVAHFKRAFAAPGVLVPGGATRLSDTDLDVLLVFLSRDTHAVAYDGHVVRLRAPSDADAAITDADRAVAQVRELVDALTHQTRVLSRRVDDLAAEARAAVARSQPASSATGTAAARAALRQKKQVEAVLAGRFATLGQLEAVAAQLQQAADHVQVVQAMAAGADALQTLHAQVGGAAGVDAVAARLRQEVDAADEIARILAEPAAAGGEGEDETALDDELAALAREEAAKTTKTAKTGDNAVENTDSAAEATRQRLAAAGAAPQTLPGPAAEADTDAAAERLQTLSLET